VPEFRILGPLEVLADGGGQLALGGPRHRAVLAVLVLQANHVVSTDFFLDALWGEQPPKTATTSLQNSIAALRRVLGPDLLLTQAPGYRLAVDPESIDLGRFERLVASARQLEPEERAERLREAFGLWRGDPLSEVAFEPFAAAEIRRLEELRLNALELRIDADIACERHADVVAELEGLVARYPLREGLHERQMLALYHSGRQAEALNVYRDLRARLSNELGLEPSPRLHELHAKMIRQEVPSPRSAEPVARPQHFEEVADALLAGRLVPVLGTDVTSLAEHLARSFDYPDEAQELTRVAQFVALTMGTGRLYDELYSQLQASAAPTAVHRFFASLPHVLREKGLPHQLLVTTGYDLSLEQALLDADEEFDVVSYIATGRDRGRFSHRDPSGGIHVIDLPNTYATELSLERRTVVLKLHGGLDDAPERERESFVVTEDDYIGYLSRGDVGSAIPVALAAKLRRSHFLFLGYGMREWSLRLILDRISGGEPLAYRSWAIVPQGRPLEHQLWRSRAVELLEQPLEEYVDALRAYLPAGPQKDAA
jgi:DNA-binding SARP family transcriptional activator